MRRWSVSILLILGMISISGRASSQTNNTFPWPANTLVGIGTQRSGGPVNWLQIHCNPTYAWDPAILRLSNGDSTSSSVFGILGLMPPGSLTTYSSLSKAQDLILHENKSGDIILTNYWPAGHPEALTGGYIRFATAGDLTYRPNDPSLWRSDYERMTIAPNGNVGIDLPPDSASGLGIPMDQLQLGGGAHWLPGIDPVPGLTFYGGNRMEGMPLRGGIIPPVDWRYLAFNYSIDHMKPDSSRYTRLARMGGSGLQFSDQWNGLVEMDAWPYDLSRGMHDFKRGMTVEVTGQLGLRVYSHESDSDQLHILFEALRPGVVGSPVTRNTNGLFFHHTPVYIGTNTADFTNLAHVHPDMGDSLTWMLAVNGPALFKEAWVNTDWPDYVFDPTYKLATLSEVEAFIKANNHLPGVPSAKELATTGVALGATSAKQMQKTEELTLYIIELNKKIERLEAKVQDLESKKVR